MDKLRVITATYNHGDMLKNLYHSLCEQTCSNFIWTIVNDGSGDNTKEIVRTLKREGKLEIEYIEKVNGGKSDALNVAFERVTAEEFVLIVDDDEYLMTDAVEKVWGCISELDDKNIGIVFFDRIDKTTGKVLSNRGNEEAKTMDYFEWKKQYQYDGYIGYMGYVLQEFRFPIFNEERYIAPSVLMMLVSQKYKVHAANISLGETEYLEGGITQQGRRLRLKNACGALYYCILLQDPRSSTKIKLKYSLLGYAYYYYGHMNTGIAKEHDLMVSKLMWIMKFPGFILSKYWRYKVINGNDNFKR